MKKGLTKNEISIKRSKVLNDVNNDDYIKSSKQLVKRISREFFNNLLELPKVKEGYLIENPGIIAFYVLDHNTIYVNSKAIDEMKKFLDRFSKLNIENQNLNIDLENNIVQALAYVIEHELCHLVIGKYFPKISKKEISHGKTFRQFVKHLFGHNWGDLAFVHIGQYIQSGLNKKKFFELLNDPNNFDDEYREKVYNILWKATTVSNFYKLFFK